MHSGTVVVDKPHAVCIPSPFQSHIKAMLKFAKLLHRKGFHITFVNTEFNHQRFLKSGGPNSLDGLPDFRFETIPDSLPPSYINASSDLASVCESIMKNFLAPFSDLLVKLNTASSDNNSPPVTCIISDGFMAFTITAARELGIPIVMLFTIAACSLMAFKQFPSLMDKGLTPLKDESYLTNGYLDTVIDWIPGMKDIRLRDLPSIVRMTNANDVIFKFLVDAVERAPKASGIVIQTFDALEREVLNALSPMFLRVYAVGPLQLLLDQPLDPLKSIGYSLRKEETECLHWLNSKGHNSVVYVNFGSLAVLTPRQLSEFGWGLANSKHPFLWIIRPDLVVGESAILPSEFEVETKERGLIAGWCPQEEVLNHPLIGGFLTHCGWNSIIESVSAGVPMLCWPFAWDQQTNCKYACNDWGIGLEIDNDVKRDEVEKLVRELMEGEKGKRMKKKVMEWKNLAVEATGAHGSSSVNLNNFVNEVLLSRG
ncbi:UDP-glycosyltransferase 85A1 [Morella rubra]|uniref:Glycosyltransferase n=1 Tax=Morella rubra TaxID=262757 RepID=A0A6A1VC53_9ROSI|nr:UDP-glycosyltransferase 85A1 [Morella rubra]